MRARATIVAVLVLGALAGCGGEEPGRTDGTGTLGEAPASASPSAAPSGGPTATAPPSDTTGHSAGNPLACRQLPDARVGSAGLPLADYAPGPVQLSGGRFDGPGGLVELQPPCGVGDLNRDGVFDAMGVVKITTGGTGRFYTLDRLAQQQLRHTAARGEQSARRPQSGREHHHRRQPGDGGLPHPYPGRAAGRAEPQAYRNLPAHRHRADRAEPRRRALHALAEIQ